MNNHIKFFKNKWVLLTAVTLMIFAGIMVSNQRATARPQEDGLLILSVKDEHSGISYDIGVDNLNNEINAQISYDYNSVAGIEKYREFNNQELIKIMQAANPESSIPVKITFNTPLNQEIFTDFVKQNEIAVQSYIIYMLEPDGKIVTIQGGPSETDLVPAEFFNTATTSILDASSPDTKFVGWVEVRGDIQINQIPQLTNNPQVFIVDVMELYLESKLTNEVDKALATAGYGKRARQELVNAGFADLAHWTVTWGAYHLGLMKSDIQQ